MTQIGSITPAALPRFPAEPTTKPTNDAGKPADDANAAATASGETQADGSPVVTAPSDTDKASDDKSKTSESVKALKEQIERMQKQLTELREHLQAVQSEHTDEREKAMLTGALETQLAMLQSAVMVATMKLAEAIANESGKILDSTGGKLPART
ncbi:hypothetical protein [Cupriavidus pampae]|uniref:Chemotaxis protein n=1 Tax=Cupriavidus pampae TaxID=659251 RepID=A0ABM8WYS7_9BURK|nr:hypothetical protein [Cupriavidus pampae]CAG9172715.1 hypothetical protein LMG32289_02660 [Cupriavidus pampae]